MLHYRPPLEPSACILRERHDNGTIVRCVPTHRMEDILLEIGGKPLTVALNVIVLGVVIVG